MDLDESKDASLVCKTCLLNLVQVFVPATLVVSSPRGSLAYLEATEAGILLRAVVGRTGGVAHQQQ